MMDLLEFLAKFTAVTDPVANIAIIGVAYMALKNHITQVRHDVRITNIERELFG